MPITDAQRAVLDRWAAVHNERMTISNFLTWLQDEGIDLEYRTPSLEGREQLLNRYFEIDGKALESARVALLETHREDQLAGKGSA